MESTTKFPGVSELEFQIFFQYIVGTWFNFFQKRNKKLCKITIRIHRSGLPFV
jgi:hypothetical protein